MTDHRDDHAERCDDFGDDFDRSFDDPNHGCSDDDPRERGGPTEPEPEPEPEYEYVGNDTDYFGFTVGPIVSFRDAVGFAMAVADRFAFANLVALLDAHGYPVDLAISEGLDDSIEPVVSWATGSRRWLSTPRSALLVSVRSLSPDVIREGDIRLYRQANWSLARAGCDLIDWVETDGDLFRSYAYLVHPALAWTDDPPGDRLADGEPT